MSDPDVLFALVGDVRRNSRALRQLRVLTDLGAPVHVLTLGPEPDDPVWEPGVRLETMERPAGSGPLWFWRMHRRARAAAVECSARVYHASDLFTLPALATAARRHGGRLAYDARELYPHVGATAGKPWATLFWYTLEHRYARRADAVFTVNDSIADRMVTSYQIDRPIVVPNVPRARVTDTSDYLRRATGVPPETPLVLFLGHLKPGRGCGLLLDAFGEVSGGALVFVGEGPLEGALRERAARPDLADRVHFHPLLPPDQVVEAASSADVGVALIEDLTASLYLSLPNKLFEYLGAGLPVVASDFPEIARVVRDHDCGLVVDPGRREEVVAALQRMIDDVDARRRWGAHTARVFETFDPQRSSQRFARVYRSLLGDPLPS